jgi:hypothetical protein
MHQKKVIHVPFVHVFSIDKFDQALAKTKEAQVTP